MLLERAKTHVGRHYQIYPHLATSPTTIYSNKATGVNDYGLKYMNSLKEKDRWVRKKESRVNVGELLEF